MRMFLKWIGLHAILVAALFPALARAAELDVGISDGSGKAVADAVVTIRPLGRVALPVHAPRRATIDQKDLAFVPYLEVLRPGDELVFRNSDRTRHHVYSFSKVRAFEFVLAPSESSPPMLLQRSGVIAVGCNIHDQMIAYLYVTDAPWLARTDASGRVHFDALPAGEYEVSAWQPRLRPGSEEPQRRIALAAQGSQALAFKLALLPDPRRMPDREHAHY